MKVQAPNTSSNAPSGESASNVTFHLVPESQGRKGEPLRRVARVTTAEDAWQDTSMPDGPFEELVVALPEGLTTGIVAFARRHIGPTQPVLK